MRKQLIKLIYSTAAGVAAGVVLYEYTEFRSKKNAALNSTPNKDAKMTPNPSNPEKVI